MYYPCSENKGADQLRVYREADLRLCFRICKMCHDAAHYTQYIKKRKASIRRESCFIQYYLYFLSSAIISLDMGCTYMYGCQTKHRKTKHLNVLTWKRRNDECDKIGKHLHLNWQWIQQSVSVHLRPFHHQT